MHASVVPVPKEEVHIARALRETERNGGLYLDTLAPDYETVLGCGAYSQCCCCIVFLFFFFFPVPIYRFASIDISGPMSLLLQRNCLAVIVIIVYGEENTPYYEMSSICHCL